MPQIKLLLLHYKLTLLHFGKELIWNLEKLRHGSPPPHRGVFTADDEEACFWSVDRHYALRLNGNSSGRSSGRAKPLLKHSKAPEIAKFGASILHPRCENISRIIQTQATMELWKNKMGRAFSEMLNKGPDSGWLSNFCINVNIIKSGCPWNVCYTLFSDVHMTLSA